MRRGISTLCMEWATAFCPDVAEIRVRGVPSGTAAAAPPLFFPLASLTRRNRQPPTVADSHQAEPKTKDDACGVYHSGWEMQHAANYNHQRASQGRYSVKVGA